MKFNYLVNVHKFSPHYILIQCLFSCSLCLILCNHIQNKLIFMFLCLFTIHWRLTFIDWMDYLTHKQVLVAAKVEISIKSKVDGILWKKRQGTNFLSLKSSHKFKFLTDIKISKKFLIKNSHFLTDIIISKKFLKFYNVLRNFWKKS